MSVTLSAELKFVAGRIVSERDGKGGSSGFSRTFREQTGMSPPEFRRSCKEG